MSRGRRQGQRGQETVERERHELRQEREKLRQELEGQKREREQDRHERRGRDRERAEDDRRARRRQLMVSKVTVAVSGALSAGSLTVSYWQFGLQSDQVRRSRQELAAAQATERAARYDATLANLASAEPERRMSGHISVRTFVRDAEYRGRARPALVEALGRQFAAYSKDQSLQPEDVRPYLQAAGEALSEGRDCHHLREVIVGVREKLKATHNLPEEVAVLQTAERDRRQGLYAPLRDHLGQFLFCSYLPSCANRVDFENTIDGAGIIFNSTNISDTVKAEFDSGALLAVGGYPQFPEPKLRRQYLTSLFAACTEEERGAIVGRACGRATITDKGLPGGPPPSCALLANFKVYGGGWTSMPP